VLFPRLGWEVKLLEPLLKECEHLTVGVPFFLQEHALCTVVVPDFPLEDWEEPVPHVDVLDEDEVAPAILNHLPPCLDQDLVPLNKSHLEGHLEP